MTLQDWLFQLCDSESPDESIVAYNFGLFETENGYAVYLTGSKEYDEDDSDWACNNDFEPASKYYHLQSDDYKDLDWEQMQDKIAGELTEFSKSSKFRTSFFSRAQAVTTGFDDGDLVQIV